MHATHGNGPPRRDAAWATVGGPRPRPVEARLLQEPQLADKLRAAGWTLPPTVPKDYPLQVYDLCLHPRWLQSLLPELHLGNTELPTHIIGGDFLTSPFRDDGEALHPGRLRRWGPDGVEPYHLLVPPRPHLAAWLERCRQQLAVEADGVQLTVCCMVPRAGCSTSLDAASLRRLVPQASTLLDDKSLEVSALLVGERPPVIRVPAKSEERVLPPRQWEDAFLARDRVLLLLRIRRAGGDRRPPLSTWIRGHLPEPDRSELELLRLEYVLPPAVRQQAAEKGARAALRKVAAAMELPDPPPHQLRQVQVAHGMLTAILGVPRGQACTWLRGSGCGGLYLRPFWTPSTGAAVDRKNFSLLWVRGRLQDGAQLWEALRAEHGFMGLLPSGGDIAVRVTAEANVEALQSQLTFKLGDARFRRAIPGQRWWRLGPLEDSEMWHVKELIRQLGLTPVRDELRVGKAGPFRKVVFFAAVEEPVKLSLDDGRWGSSAARLQPADPPPRSRAPAVRPSTQAPPSEQALPATATWGGSRQPPQPSQPPVPPRQSGGPQSSALPTSTRNRRMQPTPAPRLQSVDDFPALPARRSYSPPVRPPRVPSPRGARSKVANSRPVSQTNDDMAVVREQLQELLHELRELRRENEALKREVERLRGVTSHSPYTTAVQPLTPVQSPPRMDPLPRPSFSPVPPLPPGPPSDDQPRMDVDREREPHLREPGDSPAAKKPLAQRSLEAPLSDVS
jgi:hypothetical protein